MHGARIHTAEAPRWEVWVGSGENVSGTGGSRLSPTVQMVNYCAGCLGLLGHWDPTENRPCGRRM